MVIKDSRSGRLDCINVVQKGIFYVPNNPNILFEIGDIFYIFDTNKNVQVSRQNA